MYAVLVGLAVLSTAADDTDEEPLLFDKTALLKALRLPDCQACSWITYSPSRRQLTGERDSYLTEDIAAAERALAADPTNPELYTAVARQYHDAKLDAKEHAALDKAIAIYRRRIAADPKDGLSLAGLDGCLSFAEHRDEKESLTRRAIEVSPRRWQCWLQRALVLNCQSIRLLTEKDSDLFTNMADIESRIRSRHITDQTIADAKKLAAEALECLNKAAAYGPKEADIPLSRGTIRQSQFFVEFAECTQTKTYSKSLLSGIAGYLPETAADLRQAAALSGNDFRMLSCVAYLDLTATIIDAGMQQNPTGKPRGDMPEFPPNGGASASVAGAYKQDSPLLEYLPTLSPRTRGEIRSVVHRLQRLLTSDNQRDAAEMFAVFSLWLASDPHEADKHLEQALQKNPRLENAWNLRIVFAGTSKEYPKH